MRKVERIDPLHVDALRVRDGLLSALSGGPALALTEIPDQLIPENIALLIETGGSTGAAKIVALSSDALRASARLSNTALGATTTDRWSLSLPLHHIAGINQLLRSIDLGTDPVNEGGEFISIVPTQLYRALREKDKFFDQLLHAKKVLIGGAALPQQLLDQGRATGISLVTSYGMTEMCGGCVYDGKPLPGVDIKIGNTGRIALRGPMRAEGYFGNATATTEVFVDDWFITSDAGEISESGQLFVHGRIDDVIISGGEKISPTAVADVLRSHYPNTELYLIGVPDEEWGQALRCVMITSDESKRIDLGEIRGIVGATFGKVAAPRSLLLLSATPIKSNGKLDLHQLMTLPPTQSL